MVAKKTIQPQEEKKKCLKCQKEKYLRDYYISYSSLHADQKVPVCKICLSDMFDIKKPKESLQEILRQIDKPYISDVYETSVIENPENIFGKYMKNIGMRQYKNMAWKDSCFDGNAENDGSNNNEKEKSPTTQVFNKDNYNLGQLKSKYGYGYPDEEYFLFEDKYQQLKTSFQLLTTMHEEYFREFCVNKVKETLAKAKGNFKEAKEWAAMVKDVAEAGKLKPSQMSKADLSGGLDTFGQLARMVEENCEIMPILPRFTEKPKDKVDVTLWCFINYVRDLKGLPACEYREIYGFYDKRKEDYETQMSDSSYDGKEDDVNG